MHIPRIVVLDDDVSIVKLIDKVLAKQFADQAHISFTSNAETVIGMATAGQLDVCLTDLDMPDMNGFKVLKLLKGIDPLIQVVIMTAVSEWNAVESAFAMGACDYIIKPFATDEVQEVIQGAIKRFRRQKRDFSILAETTA